MRNDRLGPIALIGLASALSLGACSRTAEPTTRDAPTTVPSSPQSTTIPARTTTEAEVVSLVVFGDSFVAWSDWPELVATDLEAAGGVEVALDDSFAAPGSLAPYEPEMLRSNEAAIGLVADADVLVLQPRPFMAPDAMDAFMEGSCGGPVNADCLQAGVVEMRAYVDEYLDLALALVKDDAEVVVVLIGAWPVDALYPDLRAANSEAHAVLVGFVYDLVRQIEESTSVRGIAVVDIGSVFGGPGYADVTPDYLLVDDGLHLSEAGSRVVADEVLKILEAA